MESTILLRVTEAGDLEPGESDLVLTSLDISASKLATLRKSQHAFSPDRHFCLLAAADISLHHQTIHSCSTVFSDVIVNFMSVVRRDRLLH